MILFVDIDHTISNARWRDPMIGGEGGWDAYHTESSKDDPIDVIIKMISDLEKCDWETVGLTSRPEKWRQLTMNWLVRHDVPLDQLLMRPNDDYRESHVVKLDLIKNNFDQSELENAILLDDRDDIVKAIHEMGIHCFHVYARMT